MEVKFDIFGPPGAVSKLSQSTSTATSSMKDLELSFRNEEDDGEEDLNPFILSVVGEFFEPLNFPKHINQSVNWKCSFPKGFGKKGREPLK